MKQTQAWKRWAATHGREAWLTIRTVGMIALMVAIFGLVATGTANAFFLDLLWWIRR